MVWPSTHENHAIAQRHGAAAGRIDTHLGCTPAITADDPGVDQAPIQVGVVKGAAVPLLDDDLAAARRHQRMMQPPADPLASTWPVPPSCWMWTTGIASARARDSKPGDTPHDFLAAMKRLGYGEHALLHVDDHQCAGHGGEFVSAETELDGHDEFQAFAGLVGWQWRQRLCALQQIEPFLVERRHTRRSLDARAASTRPSRLMVKRTVVTPSRRARCASWG